MFKKTKSIIVLLAIFFTLIPNVKAEGTVKLPFSVDTYAAKGVDKTNGTASVINIGGNKDYVAFLKAQSDEIDPLSYPSISLNIVTYSKPSTKNTIYVYGVKQESDADLITNNVNGSKSEYASLFELDSEQLIATRENNPSPNKKTVLSFDVTDYVRSSANGKFAFRIYQEGAGGNYGYQMYSSDNASKEYAPYLQFSTGAESEVNYDATHFDIESYISDLNCVTNDFALPTSADWEGAFGSNIVWKSNDPEVIVIDGNGNARVNPKYMEDSAVKISAIFEKDGFIRGVNFTLSVPGTDVETPVEPAGAADDFTLSIPDKFDTYIRKGDDSGTFYNDSTTMVIDGRTSSLRIGVVKFLYGAGETESCEALYTAANHISLRMRVSQNDGYGNLSIYGVNDELMKNLWQNGNINYDIAGELGILSAIGTEDIPHIADIDMERNGASAYCYADVTDYVQKQAKKSPDGEASFVFLICGTDMLSANDIIRVVGESTNTSDIETTPTLLAYTNEAGYAVKDALSLNISKRSQVSESFELPAFIGENRGETKSSVTWESDNESIISIESRADGCTAAIKRPPSSSYQSGKVTLKAKIENSGNLQEKSFDIYVQSVGTFNSEVTNYIYNGSSSGKDTTNPNTTIFASSSDDNSVRRYAFVSFDPVPCAQFANRVLLRLKPYYLTGSFDITMTPITEEEMKQLVSGDMTWNTASEIINCDRAFSQTHTQSPFQTDWVEWDVTDYIKENRGKAVFMLEVETSASATAMFFGNYEKFIPQLKIYNYEVVSDPELSVKNAYEELVKAAASLEKEFSHITDDIALPYPNICGTYVDWEVTDENGNPSEYLDNDGTLLGLPQDSDAKVIIKGTVKRSDYTGEENSVILNGKVLKQVSDAEALRRNVEMIEFDSNVLTKNDSFPYGVYNADITWVCDDPAVEISGNSYITHRTDKNVNVTVTARISCGNESTTKDFNLVVLRKNEDNLLYRVESFDEETNDDNSATFYSSEEPFEIEYYLPSRKEIGSFEFVAYKPENIKSVKIDLLDESAGSTTTVLNTENVSEGINHYNITEVIADYVKLTIDSIGESGIRELAAYAPTEKDTTLSKLLDSDEFANMLPKGAVSSDFDLPKYIGDTKITWSVENGRNISLSEGELKYIAKVTQGSKATSVTLKAAVADENQSFSKNFIFYIKARESLESGGGPGGGFGGGPGASNVVTAVNQNEAVKPQNSLPFNDLENAQWAVPYIDVLYKKGIVSGKSENTFAPSANVTREEFIKMLVLSLNISMGGECSFSDIEKGDWCEPYIAAAVNSGITYGTGNGKFGRGDSVTRQDIAVMTVRALEFIGYNFEKAEDYRDMDSTSDYAVSAMRKLFGENIMIGDGQGILSPSDNATRAETAKIITDIMMKGGTFDAEID